VKHLRRRVSKLSFSPAVQDDAGIAIFRESVSKYESSALGKL